MGDRYNPERDVTPAFMQQVADWIDRTGEVLVVFRYLRAAGSKDFALCDSRSEFETLVETAPRGTDIEVFREPQLPLRGIVNSDFIAAACDAIPDGMEYLAISRETLPGSTVSRYKTGVSQAELREDLEDLEGVEVAVGICPDFMAADHEGLISASKDGIDGPR